MFSLKRSAVQLRPGRNWVQWASTSAIQSRHLQPVAGPSTAAAVTTWLPVCFNVNRSLNLIWRQTMARASRWPRIIFQPFTGPQVGPWEHAERAPVSVRNSGRFNGLCLKQRRWQTPAQRGWMGLPSVLTHGEEWASVPPPWAVFVQCMRLLSSAAAPGSARRAGAFRGRRGDQNKINQVPGAEQGQVCILHMNWPSPGKWGRDWEVC